MPCRGPTKKRVVNCCTDRSNLCRYWHRQHGKNRLDMIMQDCKTLYALVVEESCRSVPRPAGASMTRDGNGPPHSRPQCCWVTFISLPRFLKHRIINILLKNNFIRQQILTRQVIPTSALLT